MPTTSNFGWTTPADTDLVKDGALAIRTLGNGIDTSMAQLKGGTTGQVLSKTSNTDMAFTWVTQDDANAIQNAIVDAKGDLIAATANDTPARLAVGNNGETLVADSSTTTGLRWTAGNPIANPVLNSNFSIWQRGTSNVTTALAYTADRWQKGSLTHYGVSRQTTSDTTNLPFIQYCARVQRTAGSSTTTAMELAQNFESVNSVFYAGKTVTLSFYARRGSNFSAASNNINVYLYSGTGTDQNLFGPYTGANAEINITASLSTTWQRFTGTATLPSTLNEMGIYILAYPTGTAGTNDFYEITGVQIDVGSTALPFRTNAATLAGELAACQRYYFKVAGNNNHFFAGFNNSTTEAYSAIPLPVTMRTRPTTTVTAAFSNLAVRISGGTNVVCNGTTSVVGNTTQALWFSTTVASGLTAGQGSALVNLGGAEAIEMSAEL